MQIYMEAIQIVIMFENKMVLNIIYVSAIV